MYYNSRDFINDLKNYKEWKEREQGQLYLLDKLHYLRYEKIKSPLDYEIVGYKGDEAIRAIKHSTHVSNDKILQAQENIDKEIERVSKLLKRCQTIIKRVDDQLNALPEEVKKACIEVYINGYSYDKVSRDMNMSRASLIRLVKNELAKIDSVYKTDES